MPKAKQKERTPVQISAPTPKEEDRLAPHLVYATIEFEVLASDDNDAEIKGRSILDKISGDNKESYLRIKDAKIADRATGYFFK